MASGGLSADSCAFAGMGCTGFLELAGSNRGSVATG